MQRHNGEGNSRRSEWKVGLARSRGERGEKCERGDRGYVQRHKLGISLY